MLLFAGCPSALCVGNDRKQMYKFDNADDGVPYVLERNLIFVLRVTTNCSIFNNIGRDLSTDSDSDSFQLLISRCALKALFVLWVLSKYIIL